MVDDNPQAYDVVIIGAGIGGLVCGCYLAKAGMKVLMVEQHHKPGGYCTSFVRNGITFDAAAHSFGGFKFGKLGQIFDDLGIAGKVAIHKTDPSDVVVLPGRSMCFWSDVSKTIAELQEAFPAEREGIRGFFEYLIEPDPLAWLRMKTWPFSKLLSEYVRDPKLQSILSLPLFGNTGMPPARLSSFLAVRVYKEFVLDGGHHIVGGMQLLSDTFARQFESFGGELRLSRSVEKIQTKSGTVCGVHIKGDGFVPCRIAVAGCDAMQTFRKLLGRTKASTMAFQKIKTLVPSPSLFILYLGIDSRLMDEPYPGSNIWMLSHDDLEAVYNSIQCGHFTLLEQNYLLHMAPDRSHLTALVYAPFRTRSYWQQRKEPLKQEFVERIEQERIPNLSQHITYSGAATPQTLYRYTGNYHGAAYGWAGTLPQIALSEIRNPDGIKGLFLTGHWSTYGLGIPGVAYVARDTASRIVKKSAKNI